MVLDVMGDAFRLRCEVLMKRDLLLVDGPAMGGIASGLRLALAWRHSTRRRGESDVGELPASGPRLEGPAPARQGGWVARGRAGISPGCRLASPLVSAVAEIPDHH